MMILCSGIICRTVVFQTHHRQVVKLRRFFDKSVNSSADACQYILLRSVSGDSVEGFNSAVSAKEFIVRVSSLGNTVGINKYAVTFF